MAVERLEGSEFLVAADIHVDAAGARLPLLIETITSAESPLIIAGDLFDYWYERGRRVPRAYHGVIDRLAALGKPVYLIRGNRDQMAGKALAAFGFRLLDAIVVLGDTGAIVLHGDLLAANERLMRCLRRILRSRLLRLLGPLIPEALAECLAAGMAYRTREPHRKGTLDREAAEWLLKQHACRTLICGHFHPDWLLDYRTEARRIIVLPAWPQQPLLLRVRKAGVDVIRLPAGRPQARATDEVAERRPNAAGNQ